MIIFLCAACARPLTRAVQLSETLVRPEFDGRIGPDGYRRAPATMHVGFYALEPEPWGAPLLPTDEPVAVFPGGPCAGDPDGDGFLTSAGPRNTIVLHPSDAPDLLPVSEGDHTGCCGWHGQGGLNRLCPCGAAVGTEISECFTAYELHLDPAQVHARDASIDEPPSKSGEVEHYYPSRKGSPGANVFWQHLLVDLSEGLAGWTDWDGAAFEVGRSLGIFNETETFTQVKWVFWTNNPLGNALHEVLVQLTAAGVLERRDEPDDIQFRWLGR